MKILKIGLKRIKNGGGRATCSPFLICLTSMAVENENPSKYYERLDPNELKSIGFSD